MELAITEAYKDGLLMRNGTLSTETIVSAVKNVNRKLKNAVGNGLGVNLDLYEIIDLRMLSGMIGEMFTAEVCQLNNDLLKNPNIDGYPDLCDVSSAGQKQKVESFSLDKFLAYEHGGFEVKNTFGVKKSKTHIVPRGCRINSIQKRLVWKAHHRETNNLIALHSDYVDRVPQIVACFYSDQLTEDDWSVKQQPKKGSTMTSFCQTTPSAFNKLKAGMIIHAEGMQYEEFING